MAICEKTRKMLEKYSLCNHCLGRQFALLGHGLDNNERGEAIKLLLTLRGHQLSVSGKKSGISILKTMATNGSYDIAAKILRKMKRKIGKKQQCYLCEGLFDQIEGLVTSSLAEMEIYEYATFLIGIELPTRVEEREDELKAEFEVRHGESMRNEFSREIGKRISRITKKVAEYKKPDLVVILNPFTGQVEAQANPLYIEGRYRKMKRGIPQSKWICTKCKGEGCKQCNGTGKLYPESIEEIVAEPTLKKTGAEKASFHAAGREDVDVRMLGRGRPFIIEVKKPKTRFIDLQDLTRSINEYAQRKIKVLDLRIANKDAVRKLKKTETADKMYQVTVEFDRNISNVELTTLETAFTNIVVHQQTPLRVLHRRADLIREKHIYETKTKRLKPNRAEMRIYCQGGLYIKELITGDRGRTDPSIAKTVATETKPLKLDVLNVFIREP